MQSKQNLEQIPNNLGEIEGEVFKLFSGPNKLYKMMNWREVVTQNWLQSRFRTNQEYQVNRSDMAAFNASDQDITNDLTNNTLSFDQAYEGLIRKEIVNGALGITLHAADRVLQCLLPLGMLIYFNYKIIR